MGYCFQPKRIRIARETPSYNWAIYSVKTNDRLLIKSKSAHPKLYLTKAPQIIVTNTKFIAETLRIHRQQAVITSALFVTTAEYKTNTFLL